MNRPREIVLAAATILTLATLPFTKFFSYDISLKYFKSFCDYDRIFCKYSAHKIVKYYRSNPDSIDSVVSSLGYPRRYIIKYNNDESTNEKIKLIINDNINSDNIFVDRSGMYAESSIKSPLCFLYYIESEYDTNWVKINICFDKDMNVSQSWLD